MKTGCKIAYYTQINTKCACCGSRHCGNELNELTDISYGLQDRVDFAQGDALVFKSKPQLQHNVTQPWQCPVAFLLVYY